MQMVPGEKGVCHTAPHKSDVAFAGDFSFTIAVSLAENDFHLYVHKYMSLYIMVCTLEKLKAVKKFFNEPSPKPWKNEIQ